MRRCALCPRHSCVQGGLDGPLGREAAFECVSRADFRCVGSPGAGGHRLGFSRPRGRSRNSWGRGLPCDYEHARNPHAALEGAACLGSAVICVRPSGRRSVPGTSATRIAHAAPPLVSRQAHGFDGTDATPRLGSPAKEVANSIPAPPPTLPALRPFGFDPTRPRLAVTRCDSASRWLTPASHCAVARGYDSASHCAHSGLTLCRRRIQNEAVETWPCARAYWFEVNSAIPPVTSQ